MSSQEQMDAWILCPDCDLMTELPKLERGTKANCSCCRKTLTTNRAYPYQNLMGYTLAALFMLFLANLFPFIRMRISGISTEITLFSIPKVMFSEDYSSLAFLFLVLVQGIPLSCLLAVIVLINPLPILSSYRRHIARMLFALKNWAMAEIFMVSILISFVKLMTYGDISLGASFLPWCLFCVLQLRTFQYIDRRTLWRHVAPLPLLSTELRKGIEPQAGASGLSQGFRSCQCCTAVLPMDCYRCPRCYTVGWARRRHSLQWSLSLLLTALLLYIPANLLPIMEMQWLGNKVSSTIMSGVLMLWQDGAYPIAVIVFIASIIVPSLKMLAIALLCLHARGIEKGNGKKMHFVYEAVEFIGRWSMIDIFVISILSALVQMGRFMHVYPAVGALLFASVVILTLFASMVFDPRLTWDRTRKERLKESSVEQ